MAAQVEAGQGGVVRLQGGQLVAVDRSGGVRSEVGTRKRSDVTAEAAGLARSPLVLNRRLQG